MAVKVGILGLGFMGKHHFDTYRAVAGARVTAICDIDRKKLSGDWSGIAGNIGGAGKKVNLAGIRLYGDAGNMFMDPDLDVIDITLPTYLHAEFAIEAMRAGKHVICEKPLAINSREAARIVAASRKYRRKLFTGHCIRYWPHYAVARNIVRGGRYGKVISACFRRFSPTPVWTWKNWILNPKKSGAAALDLHIHDADFVIYCFGKPRAVTSFGVGVSRGRLDHIVTSYDYGEGKLITAEGGWEFAGGYPFGMSFTIVMQKATLNMTSDLNLTLHPKRGGGNKVKVPDGDGYRHELIDFIVCIAKNKTSKVVTPDSALKSVKLVEAEMRSSLGGKKIAVRL